MSWEWVTLPDFMNGRRAGVRPFSELGGGIQELICTEVKAHVLTDENRKELMSVVNEEVAGVSLTPGRG